MSIFSDLKILIFDADNTLYFTRQGSQKGYKKICSFLSTKTNLSALSIEKNLFQIIARQKKISTPSERTREKSLEILLQEKTTLSSSQIKDFIPTTLEIFWKEVLKNLKAADNLRTIIYTLSQKYILFIASDEFKTPLTKKLKKVLGSTDFFAQIITPEVSHSMKPSIQFYVPILQMFSYSPDQFLMIGDSWERDLEKAHQLGIKTLLISSQFDKKPDYHINKLSLLPHLIPLK